MTARASTGKGRPLALFAVVAAATLIVDQITKAVALAHLGSSPMALLGGIVRLTLTRNAGSAFGLPAPTWVTTAVSLVVCVVVLVWVARGLGGSRMRAASLGLVLGGAVGNLADRVRTGAVTDFIDLRVWPVFNVADIALTVGVGLMIVEVMRRR